MTIIITQTERTATINTPHGTTITIRQIAKDDRLQPCQIDFPAMTSSLMYAIAYQWFVHKAIELAERWNDEAARFSAGDVLK